MWVITKDHFTYATNREGVHSYDYDAEKFAKVDKLAIRLMCDDVEVIYEGLATRKRILDSPEERAFEVLDWAMADAGCTELQYFDNSEWQTL